MNKSKNKLKDLKTVLGLLLTGAVAVSLLSCDSIYDTPEPYVPVPTESFTYQYVNATAYTDWIYFNLHEKDSVTLDYRQTVVPISWDMAIHRYDVKTNGGAALETDYETLEALQEAVESGDYRQPYESGWVSDVEDSVTVDMSHMMEGYLVYTASTRNREIGKWLNLDLNTMPPIYTPSNKVYLVRLTDKTVAAVRFTDFMGPAAKPYYSAKGYISFDYLYPINFKQ